MLKYLASLGFRVRANLDLVISLSLAAIFVYLLTLSAAPSAWPSDGQWTILTAGGNPIVDREARSSCLDLTNGGTSPSGPNDIGSQAKCSGGGAKYNPGNVDQQFGNGAQPGATLQNTYSAATFYRDDDNNSNGCTNISDDVVFFRVRLSDNPVQNNAVAGLSNDFWWATLDVDANGIVDFYVRVNGNQGVSGGSPATTENIQVLFETTGDADPTGEPVVHTIINPLNTGYARSMATPDNGTVGDATEYFLDWQLPVTAFKSNTNTQILCEGNSILLTNYSTSANVNDPFQKDRIQALGTYSDVIITSDPEYTITKTATDVNGGALVVGDQVEYTITAQNLATNLSNFVFTDPIPAGAIYVPGTLKAIINGTTYSMSDNADSPDSGGCPASTHCVGDYNVTSLNAITLKNDWIYSAGSVAPLYDNIVIKFRVTFSSLGVKSNQGYGVTRELTNQQRTDDPNIDDASDCTTGGVINCNDSITGNDDPTLVVVIPPPPDVDLAITKTDGVTTAIPGSSLTYTIVASNAGPNPVLAATVTDTFPPSLSGISWTCSASVGSTCSPSGVGNINDIAVNLLAGGTATYTVSVNTSSSASGSLVNTANIIAPITVNDTNLANNSATDTDTYIPTDFGDAPDPVIATAGEYPTLMINNGARHNIIAGKYLGTGVDQEPDAIPNSTATGDDLNNTDDEDGVSFLNTPTQGNNTNITVTASSIGKLDAWVDFDADGNWTDPGEQIFTNQTLSVGSNALSFPVPISANLGDTFSRWRFSVAGGLSPTGPAADGEVEDYKLTIFAPPDLSTSTKDVDDTTVDPLQVITYTITVKNNGGVTATGVDVDETINANLENLNVTSITNCGAPSNTSNSTQLHVHGVNVAVGVDCVITYTVNVISSALGGASIPNTVTIAAAAEGGSGSTPSSPTLTVNSIPNLSTSTKTDNDVDNNVSSLPFGQTITYTINVKNTGNATGTGISVTDSLDTDLDSLNLVSLTNCGAYSDSSTSTSLNITNISVGVGVDCVIVFTADVVDATAGGTSIANSATISAATEGGLGATPSSDLLTVDGTVNFSTSSKSHNGDNIATPGETVVYTISIANTGNTAGSGVSVTDQIDSHFGSPGNFSYSGCGSPSSGFSDPTLTFSNVAVAAFSTCQISYDVVVDSPLIDNNPEAVIIGNSANITPANGAGTLTATNLTVDVTPNLSTSTKTDGEPDDMVDPGQLAVPYTITINNTGDGTATGVDVSDTLDSSLGNLQVVSLNNCGTGYSDSSTSTVLNISNLRIDPGISCVINLTADVDAPLAGGTVISNSATITAANEGGSGASPSSPNLTVIATPNLATSTKFDDDADNIVDNGQIITYVVTVKNTGNATGTGISMDDILDSDLENLVLGTIPGSCGTPTNTSTASELHLSNVSVAVGVDCVITFTANVKNTSAGGSTIPNSVTISAASQGGNGATPSSDTLSVVLNPILSTSTKTDSDADNIVEPLQTYAYTITVKNTGNTTASGVDIDDVLDSDLENLSVSAINNCGSPTNASSSTELHLVDATIAVGVDCVISFTARVIDGTAGGSVISNSAAISAADEGGSGTSPSSPNLTVANIPDLSNSTKTDNIVGFSVTNGETITYTVTIVNDGNATGHGIALTDTLDGDLENLVIGSIPLSCGSPNNSSTSTMVNITNITVAVGVDCVITFSADVKGSAASGSPIPNSATISPASEGGNGALVTSDTLAVNSNIILFGSEKREFDNDNQVAPGDTVIYRISVVNSGNAGAIGLTVTDTIDTAYGTPFAFNYSSCGSPNANFTSPNLTFSSVDVGAFSTCEITYSVTVDNPVIDPNPDGISIDNSAVISPANGSLTLTADTVYLNVTPNLISSVLADDDADNIVSPGQTVNYTLNINNIGNGTATGVSINDVMGSDFANLIINSINGCGTNYLNSSTNSPAVIDVSSVRIDPGTTCIIQFSADVSATLTNGETLDTAVAISPASEGGNGALVDAETLTVATNAVSLPGGGSIGVGGPYGRESSTNNDQKTSEQKPTEILCMGYDPNRDLIFTDLVNNDRQYVKAAQVLKNTYQLRTGDFVISGYNSTTQDQGDRVVGLKGKLSRLEWAKLLMISHCLKIRSIEDLPNRTILDNRMPNFKDLPRMHNGDANHDWHVDVVYSAAYYEILNGTVQNNVELQRQVSVPEGIKMMVRVGELINKNEYPRADHLVNPAINRDAWYFEFYSKAAAEGVFSQLVSSAGTINTSLVRGPAIYELLKTMLLRNLFEAKNVAPIQEYLSDTRRLS